MSRRRVILLLVVVGVVGATGIFLRSPRSDEPSYQGRPLSEWMDIYCSSSSGVYTAAEIDQAADAIRQIGTNALPLLLRWIVYEHPPPNRKLAALIYKLPKPLQRPLANQLLQQKQLTRAWAAQRGLDALGPRAAPAIPELMRLASDSRAPQTAARAVYALSLMGNDGCVALLAALSDNRTPHRRMIAMDVVPMRASAGTNVLAFVPVLARLVSDPDVSLAAESARALGQLADAPEVSIPALVNGLEAPHRFLRLDAANALAKFGSAARSGVPTLVEMLNDRDSGIREAATNALQKIAPEELLAAPGSTGRKED